MPTYADLRALSASIDSSLHHAMASGQTLAAYLLEMASLEISEQIEALDCASPDALMA